MMAVSNAALLEQPQYTKDINPGGHHLIQARGREQVRSHLAKL